MNTMKILTFVSSLFLLFSFNAAALDVKQRFDHLDSNKSGYLTQDELEPQPQLLSTFVMWDKNQDNQISLVEFKNYLTNNLY
jgi:Ca2+-binding EF-hand superfamily protein|tara:strand:- start:2403 stop:2648 length:246 start_codon:yes stop_codon:yes gene_type:complete